MSTGDCKRKLLSLLETIDEKDQVIEELCKAVQQKHSLVTCNDERHQLYYSKLCAAEYEVQQLKTTKHSEADIFTSDLKKREARVRAVEREKESLHHQLTQLRSDHAEAVARNGRLQALIEQLPSAREHSAMAQRCEQLQRSLSQAHEDHARMTQQIAQLHYDLTRQEILTAEWKSREQLLHNQILVLSNKLYINGDENVPRDFNGPSKLTPDYFADVKYQCRQLQKQLAACKEELRGSREAFDSLKLASEAQKEEHGATMQRLQEANRALEHAAEESAASGVSLQRSVDMHLHHIELLQAQLREARTHWSTLYHFLHATHLHHLHASIARETRRLVGLCCHLSGLLSDSVENQKIDVKALLRSTSDDLHPLPDPLSSCTALGDDQAADGGVLHLTQCIQVPPPQFETEDNSAAFTVVLPNEEALTQETAHLTATLHSLRRDQELLRKAKRRLADLYAKGDTPPACAVQ